MNKPRNLSKYIVKSGQSHCAEKLIYLGNIQLLQPKQLKTCSNQNNRIICRRCLPCTLYRVIILFNFICSLFTKRRFVLEGFYSSIHALARALKVGVQGCCMHQGIGFLGCSIHYCSHVKSTSYSIPIKTKHWQTNPGLRS